MKDQYKKVSQKHMLGFMYYLQLLGYVIVRQGMDQAMFLTKHYAVPVAWRRITIDYHNRLNKPAQQLYREFVEWTKEEYLRAQEMMDLKTKQAFWSEQLPFFKEKYWIPGHLDVLEFDMNGGCFDIVDGIKTDLSEEDLFDIYHRVNSGWAMWKKAVNFMKSKVPTWISVTDELPPTDIMVLICWADAPDVTPEQDYMTIDEDLNSVWANYQNDPPSHWMHFHSVPNVSGAEQ